MPHPGHQVACADLGLCRPDVAGVPQVVEVHALQAELRDNGRPSHPLSEVGPADRAALITGEQQRRRAVPDPVAEVLDEVGADGLGDDDRPQTRS